jgi:hypothetical protein
VSEEKYHQAEIVDDGTFATVQLDGVRVRGLRSYAVARRGIEDAVVLTLEIVVASVNTPDAIPPTEAAHA